MLRLFISNLSRLFFFLIIVPKGTLPDLCQTHTFIKPFVTKGATLVVLVITHIWQPLNLLWVTSSLPSTATPAGFLKKKKTKPFKWLILAWTREPCSSAWVRTRHSYPYPRTRTTPTNAASWMSRSHLLLKMETLASPKWRSVSHQLQAGSEWRTGLNFDPNCFNPHPLLL